MTALVPLLGLVTLMVVAFHRGEVGSFLDRQFAPEPGLVGVVDRHGSFSSILPAYM